MRDQEMLKRLYDLGELRIKEMDEAGIDIQVLSHGAPSAQKLSGPEAVDLTRRVNDRLAEAVAAQPEPLRRLRGAADSDPKAAADELERTVTKLGFKGAMIHGLSERQVPRRQGVLADLRARREARRADLFPPVAAACRR